MNRLLILMAIACIGAPVAADAGCRRVQRVAHVQARRAVQQVAYRNAFGFQAQFVAVEEPVYLGLVAAQKRQELQLAQYQAAVQQGVQAQLAQQQADPTYDAIVEKLEGLRIEVEKFRKGDKSDTPGSAGPAPGPAVPPAAGPTVPTADPAAPGGDGSAGASADLVKFLEAKCAQCHKGAGAEAGFALFGDDGAPQLTPGKLIQADLATYSNRMPPKEKLTEEEYGGLRALYQTWERELREFARKE